MFDTALRTARELDKYFKNSGTVKGPLHGLPISLKDQFHVEGYDTTMGYVGWIETYEGDEDPARVHKVDSQIVKELLSLGAVLYCKVNFRLYCLPTKAEAVSTDQSAPNPLGMLDDFSRYCIHSHSTHLLNFGFPARRDNQQHHWYNTQSSEPTTFVWRVFWGYVFAAPSVSQPVR